MGAQFTSEFFEANRRKLQSLFTGKAPIVLTAHGLLQRSSDETYPFRQDRNFWYLTGIEEPDAILVIDKAKEYLILSEDHPHRVRFDGALDYEALAQVSGIEEVLDAKVGWSRLQSRLKKVKHVATLAASPAYVPFYGFYANPSRATLIERIKDVNSRIELLDLRQHLTQMRMVKQPLELDAIKQAIAITERSIKATMKKAWSEQATEIDIANELSAQFKKNDADDLAFDSVVSFGAHTVAIHHRPDRTVLGKQDLVLLDVGAESNHYAADISRVFSAAKTSKRTRQVFAAAHEALQQALTMLKPGLTHQKFETDMEQVVGEKLRELGLIKTIDRESVRKYFPTYTAHQMGLDVHDVHELEKPLLENMVMAVEPGIYIPEEGIGIRIEEDVRITENGIELMTNALPQDLVSLTMK